MITHFPGRSLGRAGDEELTVTGGTFAAGAPTLREQGLRGARRWREGAEPGPAPLKDKRSSLGGGGALTDPLLQAGGGGGLGGPGLTLLQGTASEDGARGMLWGAGAVSAGSGPAPQTPAHP